MSKYLSAAWDAVRAVKEKLHWGASTDDDNVARLGAAGNIPAACVWVMRGDIAAGNFQPDEAYFESFTGHLPREYRVRSLVAQGLGCGNCGEQAIMALQYLNDYEYADGMMPPLDLSGVQFDGNDHQFVIVGRQTGSNDFRDVAKNIQDVAAWGPDAVICDAWKGRAYPAMENKDLFRRTKPGVYLRVTSYGAWEAPNLTTTTD